MDRIYLFVPPEEKADVQSLGARWDTDSKRWYIESDESPGKFSRWLPGAESDEEEEFTITSSEAYVASASVRCRDCGAGIEAICIHCESGSVSGDPLERFTVSDVWAMDEALVRQLHRWPTYRRMHTAAGAGGYANHCSQCGVPQEEMDLHSEPEAPFFNIPAGEPGSIKLTPLIGTVRLSGDEHFEVD